MKILKKADFILIILFAALAIVFDFVFGAAVNRGGASADSGSPEMVVMVDGKEYLRASLGVDKTYTIDIGDFHNVIEVKDGAAKMTDANCPDHYCMNQQAIRYSNQIIVCLPHKLVVEVENGSPPGDDVPDVVPY